MINLNRNVLVLNQNYEPIAICNARKAIVMVYLGKAEIVESYSHEVHSVSITMPFPCVVRLQIYIYRPFKPVMLNRKNILRRDRHTCQYCGRKTGPMTVDHIIPRQYGGRHSWENLVCACIKCNNMKGNHTPEQMGMVLRKNPANPSRLLFLQFFIDNPHEKWRPYLFLN